MARLRGSATHLGEYLDYVSDKLGNILVLFVLYVLTGREFGFLMLFMWWDAVMAFWLTADGLLGSENMHYRRAPLEFVVKTTLWVALVLRVFPALV